MRARIVGMTNATDLKSAGSPREVWERLREGNERFAAGNAEAPHRDAATREALTSGQQPAVCVVGCSDSRVPVELDRVLADIRGYAQEDPAFWKPSPLLVQLAESGRNFASLNQTA